MCGCKGGEESDGDVEPKSSSTVQATPTQQNELTVQAEAIAGSNESSTILEVIENSEGFTLISFADSSVAKPAEKIHGYPVSSKVEVDDQSLREQLVGSLRSALDVDAMYDSQLNPEFGIQSEHEGVVDELLIGFSSGQAVWYRDGKKLLETSISLRPRALFGKVFGMTGMPAARRPLVVFSIAGVETSDDPGQIVYDNAYGLEMQLDNEWYVDTVMLVVPEYVDVIANRTGLLNEEAAFAGTTSVPKAGAFQEWPEGKIAWVELDSLTGLASILKQRHHAILRINASEDISAYLSPLAKKDVGANPENMTFAIEVADGTDVDAGQKRANIVRQELRKVGLEDCRIVVATTELVDDVFPWMEQGDIDGFYVANATFDSILDTIADVSFCR
ncbi:hypothetical protein [Planctomycetes bacterium CA13]|uniref:hypothetical protein n=1 Tax=Novipirellula herctigrandis TaxID=2527986 RepID=UPI0011B7D40C